MVKIPGLNDLKKMGTDIIDTAKTVKMGGVVDKFKETVGGKKTAVVVSGDNPLKNLVQNLSATLNELTAAQATEANLIKRMQEQLREIAKFADAQNTVVPAQPEGDKK